MSSIYCREKAIKQRENGNGSTIMIFFVFSPKPTILRDLRDFHSPYDDMNCERDTPIINVRLKNVIFLVQLQIVSCISCQVYHQANHISEAKRDLLTFDGVSK